MKLRFPAARNASVPAANAVNLPSASIEAERRYGARNYEPLPVVMAHGEGVWLWDEHGRRYLDMLSAYSAVSHGHAHPRIVQALIAQAQRLAVTSRAVHTDKLP
ncbi:MAG TPA: aminotransferase class III-fold pyridoxal phosphate-dependent enzyme, partial [Casimicrobiaceae bacterium]|nr:aminotransferase class III-fold pyridoxal phosphate-dependent enzyme [Casimicrobiaceae bacterium]